MINQIWAAERNSLLTYLEIINKDYFDEKQVSLFGIPDEDLKAPEILSIDGETASIEIAGFLTKVDLPPFLRLLGIQGTSFNKMLEAVNKIRANRMINKVRLIMNTPGGEALGTDEVHQAIAALTKDMPVIAENHGQISSGGYWIASAASEIVSLSPVNITGSIGVIVTGFDQSERLSKMGVKKVIILSENAPKKAGLNSAEGRSGIQEEVNAIERVFLQRISEGRGIPVDQIANTFGQGGVLIAQDPHEKEHDALSVGMIDRVISGVTQGGNASVAMADDGGCGGGT